jgi:hypothetical protein
VPRETRIKEYNLGAALPLRTDDLFKATWFPDNRGVHMCKVIGGPGGEIEYGEYVIRTPGASHFHHSTFTLPAEHLTRVLPKLEALRALRARSIYDDDQEPQRRVITLWSSGQERAYLLPAEDQIRRLRITRAYRDAFEQAWHAIVAPVQAIRAEHHRGPAAGGEQ